MQRPASASSRKNLTKRASASSRDGSVRPESAAAATAAIAAAASTTAQLSEHNLAPLRAAPPAGRSLEATLGEELYMDQIIHKLQLLGYEKEFCRRKKPHRKTLSVTYFATQQAGLATNDQFFYFTSLAAWLLQLCGVSVQSPKEFDDPNATLQALLQGLRTLGFAAPSYPPNKLGQGYGREVCALLDGLLDATMERRGLLLGRPSYSMDNRVEDDVIDEADMEGEAADIAIQLTSLQAEESEHEAELVLRSTSVLRTSVNTLAAAAEAAAVKQVLVSTVDPVYWKLEAERVAPKLRLALAADAQDWRHHLEAAHSHADLLKGSWPDVKVALSKLSVEVAVSLEKVQGREQQLNDQFQGQMEQYQAQRLKLMAAQEEYNRHTELLSEGNNELHRLAAALDDVKQQLDSKGSNLSDATPLVRLKAALTGLRGELRAMELRIGVVAHNLMSFSRRDKQSALQGHVAWRQQHQ